MSQISVNLRALMKQKGWSMSRTAKMANLPLPTVRSIIYGQSKNQKQSTLSKIANAFECSIDSLTCRIDNDNNVASYTRATINVTISNYKKLQNFKKNNRLKMSQEQECEIIEKLNAYTLRKAGNKKIALDDNIIEWLLHELELN